jgi:predicted  nucleic acid-binding Zn-ribbon protein
MARNRGRKPADALGPAPKPQQASSKAAAGADAAQASAAANGAAFGRAIEPRGGAAASAGPTAPAEPESKPGVAAAAGPAKPGSGSAAASGSGGAPGRSQPSGGGSPPGGTARRSFRNGLIGGLAGGVVGGIVASLILTFLLIRDDRTKLEDLRAQVTGLDQKVAQTEGGIASLDQLSSRVGALEKAAPSAIGDELKARVDALEQAQPSVADLANQVKALEQAVGSASEQARAAPATQERLAALESKVGALSSSVAAGEGGAAPASDVAALQSRLSALDQSTTQTGQSVQKLDDQMANNQSRLEELSGQVAGLDGQMKGLHERADALSGQVDGLTTRLAETESRVKSAGDRRAQAAALALIAAQLDTAIGQSRPYSGLLESLTALGKDDQAVGQAAAELAPMAATGVPSLAELRHSFEATADEIVQRSRAPAGNSVIDQAASNLLRLVTVRPVGSDVEGDSPPARVARAEAQLANGDLAAAVAELEPLQGPAAEAAADWLQRAHGRLNAEAAIGRLQARTTELLTEAS